MESNTLTVPLLQIATWAEYDKNRNLVIDGGVRPIQMCNSNGTGSPLLSFNEFGADIIRFAAKEGVMNHTHEGDHILFVLKGSGVVEYNQAEFPLYPGLCYLIPGEVDHAIRAEEDLVMIAVGNKHRTLDSVERMVPVNK